MKKLIYIFTALIFTLPAWGTFPDVSATQATTTDDGDGTSSGDWHTQQSGDDDEEGTKVVYTKNDIIALTNDDNEETPKSETRRTNTASTPQINNSSDLSMDGQLNNPIQTNIIQNCKKIENKLSCTPPCAWVVDRCVDTNELATLKDTRKPGDDCSKTLANKNVKRAKWDKDHKCVIKACNDGYTQNDDGTACNVSVTGSCHCTDTNAKECAYTRNGRKCVITACDENYDLKRGKCVKADTDTGGEQSDAENTDTAPTETSTTSGKQYTDEEIKALEDKAKAAKENETSLENRILGATSMAAVGGGLSAGAAALAEQRADEVSERDMAAYLATFRCEYGNDGRATGGTKNIDLPGGNQVTPLAMEYKTLAADLKRRKDALGMAPGIEAELPLDAADTGLYNNENIGRTGGAFTSIYRALTDEDGEDAKKLAEQKEATKTKLTAGLATAGVGAVASTAANIMLNGDETTKGVITGKTGIIGKVKVIAYDFGSDLCLDKYPVTFTYKKGSVCFKFESQKPDTTDCTATRTNIKPDRNCSHYPEGIYGKYEKKDNVKQPLLNITITIDDEEYKLTSDGQYNFSKNEI